MQSYLLFFPDDSEMQQNKRYYLGLPEVKAGWFRARPEAVEYSRRQADEVKMMEFIEKNFKFDDEDEQKIEPIVMYRVRLDGKDKY